jgi:hypothetical protein
MSCYSQMSKKMLSTCNTCHFCYQPTTKRVEKQTCQVSIGTTRLHLDASCNENGLSLFLDLAPCFLVPVIVEYSKLVTMEAKTLLNYNILTSLMKNIGSSGKEHTSAN